MRRTLLAILAVAILAAGASAAVTITVPTDHTTVHDAVAAAQTGDTVYVLNNTYTFNTTLNINKAITLRGESEGGVIFDINTGAGYGIHPSVGGIVMEDFTLNVITSTGTDQGYIVHASGTPNVQNGIEVRRVTIQGSGSGTVVKRRAGLDIHGYDNVIISHVTSNDATWGNGIQITGCSNVTVDNCSTTNNAWGSLAVYVSQYIVPGPRASSFVTIDGPTCSFGEGVVFTEDQFGAYSTDIVVTGYEYITRNMTFRSGADAFSHFHPTFAVAQAFAAIVYAGFEDTTSYEEIATGDFTVLPGVTIQAAIDAAGMGDTIVIAAGHYEEQLHVTTENLTLAGAGVGSTFIDSPPNLTLFYSTSADNYPIVFVEGVNAFTMNDLTVDGLHRGTANYRFQGVGFWNAGGTMVDVEVNNIMDTAFSGAQHANGVYAYNNTGGPYLITMTDVDVNDFQKTGVVLSGAGLTVDLTRVTTPGQGPTAVTAQNGIQVSYGASGTLTDCVVEEIEWTGGTWTAAGVLIYDAGTIVISGGSATNAQVGVYNFDADLALSGMTITGSTSDAAFTYASGAKAASPKQVASPMVENIPVGGNKAPPVVTYDNCIFIGTGLDAGSWGPGVYAVGDVSFTVTNCSATGFGYGLVIYEDGGIISGYAHDNTFTGNVTFDASFVTAGAWDASLNYWGGVDPTDVIEFTAKAAPSISPWYELPPGSSPMIWGTTGSIQAAIDAASSGDSINLASMTYTPTAQVIIYKDVNLTGASGGTTTVAAGFNTTGGSYSTTSSMFYVDYGVTTVLKDITFDGTGWAVQQAVQSRGADVTIQDCVVSNIMASIYDGRGLVFLTGNGLVQNCVLTNIQRIGVHIRGGAIAYPAPDVDVVGLDYTGKGVGDWLDYGVEFGGGGLGTVDISTITDCSGVADSDGSTSAAILVTDYYGTGTTADITDSDLSGNSSGMAVGYAVADLSVVTIHGCDLSSNPDFGISSTGPFVDALDNWWGAATGPYHPTTNPLGVGVEVEDNIDYNPWLGMGGVAVLPDVNGPINCSDTQTITVRFTPDGNTPALRGYTITVDASAELTFAEGDIYNSDPFNGLGSLIIYDTTDNLDGTITVDCAIAGPTVGLTVAADLFTVIMSPVTDGIGTVDLLNVTFRDVDNADITALVSGATITVDCTNPPAVTGLTSAPGHEQVSLDWTMADASDVDYYEIWRAVWHTGDNTTSAYPEYDDVNVNEPVWPADRAAALASGEWELLLLTAPGAAVAYVDSYAPRGVYYYEVFAVDAAGNVGPGHGPLNRATNYFLGDFDLDGVVLGVGDLTPLGTYYGTAQNTGDIGAYTDIGPTDTSGGLGIPETDSIIGFEDLMIFALNYDTVSKTMPTVSDMSVAVAWTKIDDQTWTLELSEPCDNLQGLSLRAFLPEGVTATVSAGSLLDQQASPTFVRNIDRNGLDVGVALLGGGVSIRGQGALLTVELSAPVELQPVIDARGLDNSTLELAMTTGVSDLPSAFALHGNHPNPFNPSTKIAYDMPKSGKVRLSIYDLDGSLVRTLVNENVTAGQHVATWNGRDNTGRQVASGAYFYRIESGAQVLTRKMLLVK